MIFPIHNFQVFFNGTAALTSVLGPSDSLPSTVGITVHMLKFTVPIHFICFNFVFIDIFVGVHSYAAFL